MNVFTPAFEDFGTGSPSSSGSRLRYRFVPILPRTVIGIDLYCPYWDTSSPPWRAPSGSVVLGTASGFVTEVKIEMIKKGHFFRKRILALSWSKNSRNG